MTKQAKPKAVKPADELEALKKEVASLTQQFKAIVPSTRTDREVLDNIDNNVVLSFKGITERVVSLEKAVGKVEELVQQLLARVEGSPK